MNGDGTQINSTLTLGGVSRPRVRKWDVFCLAVDWEAEAREAEVTGVCGSDAPSDYEPIAARSNPSRRSPRLPSGSRGPTYLVQNDVDRRAF